MEVNDRWMEQGSAPKLPRQQDDDCQHAHHAGQRVALQQTRLRATDNAAQGDGNAGDGIHASIDDVSIEEGRDEGEGLERPHDQRGIDLVEIKLVREERLERAEEPLQLRAVAAAAEVADGGNDDADGGGQRALDGKIHVKNVGRGGGGDGRGRERGGRREEVSQPVRAEEQPAHDHRWHGEDYQRPRHRRGRLVGFVPTMPIVVMAAMRGM